MKTIHVPLQACSYDIYIANGVLLKTGKLLKSLGASQNVVIVTNSRVQALHGNHLQNSLRESGFSAKTILVPDGERFKSLSTMQTIYKHLARYRVDRNTWLLAFGGGVIGDTAGFAAATFLRGIPLVQIPTTLLGQIDSSIGGKTGVNLIEGKNLVGAFYQPAAVLVDPLVLHTLPPREFRSGLYEALKYGIIWDETLFHLIDRKHPYFPKEDPGNLEKIIARCASIKAEVVSKDERESGLRMVLNYGHTFGHALEAVTDYRQFTHGEAVGHGMIMAAQLATALRWLSVANGSKIEKVISRVARLPSVCGLNWRKVLQHMMNDKKIVSQKLRFVLPRQIGRVEIFPEVPLKAVVDTLHNYLELRPGSSAC